MKNEFKNTFGDRLEFLMKEKGINTTEKGANTKLAKDMLKTKCLPFYVNEALKAQESARVRIGEHRKTISAESIEGKWLKAYCDYFGCSADYLFGYISLTTHEETNIEKETGLSRSAIKQLQHFTTYKQGKIRLAIIDYFLRDSDFSIFLTDSINTYYSKYDYYEAGRERYFKESEQLNNLAGDDLIKIIELHESGEFVQTISQHELTERENSRDAAQFKVIKLFDDILEALVKYFYKKNNIKEFNSN